MHDQGKEFIGHDFIKYLIETEHRITATPSTLVNPMSNAILELIYQVLGNLVQIFNIQQTYVDEKDWWTGILDASTFAICPTTKRKKGYSPGQLIFGRETIILIKHMVDWELIRHKRETQINRHSTHENRRRVDYNYKVGDNVMITKHTA